MSERKKALVSNKKRQLPDWNSAKGSPAKEKKTESQPCESTNVLTTESPCTSTYVSGDEGEEEGVVTEDEDELECNFCGTKGHGKNIRTYDEDTFDAQMLCRTCAESYRTDWLGDGVEKAPKLY